MPTKANQASASSKKKQQAGTIAILVSSVLVVILAAIFNFPGYSPGNFSQNNRPARLIQQAEDLVNINTATVEELMALPGIGEKRAAAIVQHREQNGEFTACEQLIEVKGISNKIFAAIKEKITV